MWTQVGAIEAATLDELKALLQDAKNKGEAGATRYINLAGRTLRWKDPVKKDHGSLDFTGYLVRLCQV